MKTKMIRLTAVLAALLVTMNLQAQVTIGSLNPPQKGAILDLNSAVQGGLLFPNVTIAALDAIPVGFAGSPGDEDKVKLKGMVVYNKAGEFAEGLYVWDGSGWINLSDAARITELQADINGRIGSLGTLMTDQKGSVVESINSLKEFAQGLSQSHEVLKSPFLSHAAFLLGAGHPDTLHADPVYAYVTFTVADTVGFAAKGGRWGSIAAFDTWRLDYSTTSSKWSPTSNMTAAINATLGSGTSTLDLQGTGTLSVTDWLQAFRNNLAALLPKFETSNGALKIEAGGTGAINSAAARTNLGLGNVDNTTDLGKPISNLTQAALDTKQAKLTATGTTNLLVAPSVTGGQPTTKPIADFALSNPWKLLTQDTQATGTSNAYQYASFSTYGNTQGYTITSVIPFIYSNLSSSGYSSSVIGELLIDHRIYGEDNNEANNVYVNIKSNSGGVTFPTIYIGFKKNSNYQYTYYINFNSTASGSTSAQFRIGTPMISQYMTTLSSTLPVVTYSSNTSGSLGLTRYRKFTLPSN